MKLVLLTAFVIAQQLPLIQRQNLRLLSDREGYSEMADPDLWSMQGRKFIDITEHADLGDKADTVPKIDVPTELKHQEAVKQYLSKYPVDLDQMRANMVELTSFRNRHYQSETGLQAAEWMESKVQSIIDESGAKGLTVKRVDHRWKQFSLIVRFEPIQQTKDAPVTIISAHYDGVKGWFGEHMPAADDDGSGSTTILQAFTMMCRSPVTLKTPVEFHWYSGEEAGLLASQVIAKQYQKEKRAVKAVVHFDMTGYKGKVDAVGIITDNVSQPLTKFVKKLMVAYTGRQVLESKCGYGCSDHASWTKAGYSSAFPFESTFKDSSPWIHKTSDTIEHIDFEHMSSFVQTAVAAVMELAM